MSKNLALWSLVEKTDPAHVKPITGKSYSGNSPKPHWLILKATEMFGPCGIGWGFQVVDERIENGSDGDRMSFARVRLWYEWDGRRGEVEHVGGTPFSGKRKKKNPTDQDIFFADEDAPKKSVTDAIIKALSLIGFAGDIFLGRWDDSKYVEQLNTEFRTSEKQESSARYLDESTQFVAQCELADELRTWWKSEETERNAILTKIQAAGLLQACKKRISDIEKHQTVGEVPPTSSASGAGVTRVAPVTEGAAVGEPPSDHTAAPTPDNDAGRKYTKVFLSAAERDEARSKNMTDTEYARAKLQGFDDINSSLPNKLKKGLRPPVFLREKGDAIAKHGEATLDKWLDELIDADDRAAISDDLLTHWRAIAKEAGKK